MDHIYGYLNVNCNRSLTMFCYTRMTISDEMILAFSCSFGYLWTDYMRSHDSPAVTVWCLPAVENKYWISCYLLFIYIFETFEFQ